jgi:hypothetical protein
MVMRAIGCVWTLSLPCGRFTFIALGTTMVDVSIKKINSRKMMSVIDDIEKSPMVLVLLFII